MFGFEPKELGLYPPLCAAIAMWAAHTQGYSGIYVTLSGLLTGVVAGVIAIALYGYRDAGGVMRVKDGGGAG